MDRLQELGKPRRLRLVAYLRLFEGEDESSLGLQEATIENWAGVEGHEVLAVMEDDEGVYVEECRGLAKALRYMADGRADGMVVTDFDRLGPTLTIQECAFAEIFGLDAYLFTVDDGLCRYHGEIDTDPIRHAFRQIVTALFSFERALASSGYTAEIYRVLRLQDEA